MSTPSSYQPLVPLTLSDAKLALSAIRRHADTLYSRRHEDGPTYAAAVEVEALARRLSDAIAYRSMPDDSSSAARLGPDGARGL